MNVSQGAPSTEGEARRTKVAYGLDKSRCQHSRVGLLSLDGVIIGTSTTLTVNLGAALE